MIKGNHTIVIDFSCGQHILPGELLLVVALLFNVHSKHLRSCRDGQLT